MDGLTALYVGVALTFSSTIIIIKLLSDKKEVNTLHGKIAIGFLIVQDLIVVLAMMIFSAFNMKSATAETNSAYLLNNLLLTFIFLFVLALFSKFIASHILRKVTSSPELIIIFAISWASLLAAIGDYLGFSKELGGLLAGMSLASTSFREALVARLSSLRDFLLLFFFIALGSKLELTNLGSQLSSAITFSLFVLIGNPIIVMIIMGMMGYRKRTSFMAGLTVAQISEFSLIFVAMGLSLGHVQEMTLGLVTLVGLITIATSVYMITYSQQIYYWLERLLNVFERKSPMREMIAGKYSGEEKEFDVIIFGLGRYGSAVVEQLTSQGIKTLGIDFNPEVIREWKKGRLSCRLRRCLRSRVFTHIAT